MARLPQSADLGRRVPRPVRGTVGVRGGIAEQGQAAVAESVSHFGRSVSDVGEAIQQRRDTVESADAKSQYLKAEIETRRDLDGDPDFATYQTRYEERMGKVRDRLAAGLSSNITRKNFQLEIDNDIAAKLETVGDMAFKREKDIGRAGLEDLVSRNTELISLAEDDATRIELLESTRDAIEDAKERRYLTDLEAAEKRASFGTAYLTQRNAAITEQLNDQIEIHRNALLTNPLQFGERRRELAGRISASGLPATAREKLSEAADQGLALSAVQGAIEENPQRALANLKAGTFDAFINPGNKASLMAAAQRKIDEGDRGTKIERNRVKGLIEDEIASLTATGVGIEGLRNRAAAVLEPEEFDAYLTSIGRARQAHDTIELVKFSTPEDAAAQLEEIRPRPGSAGFADQQKIFEAVSRETARLFKQRADDPAGYVSAMPEVAEALEAAEQDPSLLPEAISASLAAQEAIGLAVFERRMLSNVQANAIVGQITAPQEGQSQAQAVQGLADQYGTLWPRVYGELVDAGLPGGILVMAGMTRPGQVRARGLLAEAQAAGTKALKEAVGDDVAGDVETALVTEMIEFNATMAQVPGGATTQNQYRDATMDLALLYKQQGATASEAAKRAYNDVIGDHYHFEGTYRVPIEFDPGTVRASTETFLRSDLPKLDIETPESLDSRLNSEQAKEQYVRAIQDKGYWLINRDETGLILFDEQGFHVSRTVEFTDAGRRIFRDEEGNRFSERSATREVDDQFVNFPTVFGGEQISEDDAFQRVQAAGFRDPETGRRLNFFDTVEAAEAAARERSESVKIEQRPEPIEILFEDMGIPEAELEFPEGGGA